MSAETSIASPRLARTGRIVVLPALLALLIWAQFRGLDLLDAATHFLTYQFPEDNPDGHTRYHLVARPLWLLCGGSVPAFRLLCLALLLGAATVFWLGWRSVVCDALATTPAAAALGLSTLAGLAWLPVLLGYNSLSTFFSLLALAALAPALALTSGPPWPPSLRWASGAAFLGLTFCVALVKPPAALALICWGGFLMLTLLPVHRFWRWLALVLAAASATAVLLYLERWIGQTFKDPTALIVIAGVQLQPQWILDTLQRYGNELSVFLPSLGQDLLWMIAPALVLAGAVVARRLRPSCPSRWIRLIAGAFFAALVLVVTVRGLWNGSFATAVSGEMARLYLLLWVSLLPALLLAWCGNPTQQTRPGLIALAFLFLPLTCGFGSTNTLYFSALHWTVLWTGGLLIASRCVSDALGEPFFHRGFAVTLLLAAAAHLWTGHFLQPYMHQPPLWRQTVPVSVGNPATTLRLDEPTARFIGEVRTTLEQHGYQPGDDVFGFFNLPGVIYAIGARSPGAPWYFGTWYHGSDLDGGKIRAVPPDRRRRAWIITQADLTHFRREFLNCGIDFPDGYEMIGRTTNPSTSLAIGIWKPKSRP